MTKYTIVKYYDLFGNDKENIRNNETGFTCPPDLTNTEYQQYLAWVAEGNVADVEQMPAPVCPT